MKVVAAVAAKIIGFDLSLATGQSGGFSAG